MIYLMRSADGHKDVEKGGGYQGTFSLAHELANQQEGKISCLKEFLKKFSFQNSLKIFNSIGMICKC